MAVKEAKYDLILTSDECPGGNPYPILAEVREKHHQATIEAKIALAWKKGITADADGHVILGLCVKAGELQRELVDYDFCIVLNREVWASEDFSQEQREALIDHEMCHVAHAVDAEGGVQMDSKNRYVWRISQHDIEEFNAIIDRHGCYKADLERFAQRILEKKNLLALTEQPQLKIVRGEPILIPPKSSMGCELIDPFPDGRVY